MSFSTCPPENEIAAFAHGRLADEARSRLALHIADCAACSDQLAFLKKADDLEARVPDRLLAEARGLRRRIRSQARVRFAVTGPFGRVTEVSAFGQFVRDRCRRENLLLS
jgi:anti-sigma factor RsiW